MRMEAEDQKEKILSMSFNQDQECFACGTEIGIRVYNTNPYKGSFKRDFNGGIGQVAMLFRSNVMALVGGGARPKYPDKKVMIWDDEQQKCIGEICFRLPVKTVKLHMEHVIVALESEVYVYQLMDLKFIDSIDTYNNPLGLCAISSESPLILACPYKTEGFLRIINIGTKTHIETSAHKSALTALALTPNGSLCASSSVEGKIIRVFSSTTGMLLQEFRRGSNRTTIHCLSFDKSGDWLACSSDRETIHIFSNTKNKGMSDLSKGEVKDAAKSPSSSSLGLIPYFSQEKSFAQFRVAHSRSLVGFCAPGTFQLVVLTYTGSYYKIKFDPKKGGECKKVEEKLLYKDQ
eukprot:TRINITY_DN1737_c0_g1_i9.p1 TRINITY_DN1737_c0_g1~~TRINITY_DN1737_c0_g1_i9.p1  ORF type:complete len:348 (-),score=59.26 TRINITY_DN1737_c0_g1_i9:100-1143(-)